MWCSRMKKTTLRKQHWFKRWLLSFLPDRPLNDDDDNPISYGKYWCSTYYEIGPTMEFEL